jgi:perosamine synthetase
VGRRHAVAVSSGTAALHLCIKALDIGEKDEVLTTAFTFVASTNCVLYERALPSFIDVDAESLNMDVCALRHALECDYMVDRVRNRVVNRMNGRTLKAILPIHVFGLPCDMPQIMEIAREWGLHVIEDACEALGSVVAGRQAGTYGDAAAFAFYPNKQMTTGEGGMVVTDSDEIAEYCRSVRNQGRDSSAAWLRHAELGYNYRLSEIHAALGVAQLDRLDDFLEMRARLAELYTESLGEMRQVALPWTPPGFLRSWFAYVIQLRGLGGPALRERLMAGLRARGIECQAYFPPVHKQPYLKDVRLLPNRVLTRTESAAARSLALPLFSSMTPMQVAEVSAAVRDILSESPAIAARVPREPKSPETKRRMRGAA